MKSFNYRVNYAALCLRRGTQSRAFDSCFEMFDGDAVVTALVRKSNKNSFLKTVIPASWIETANKYSSIPDKELSALAAKLRSQTFLDNKI